MFGMNKNKCNGVPVKLVLAAVMAVCQTGRCTGQERTAGLSSPDGALPSFEAATIRMTAAGNLTDAQWSKPGGSTFRATNISLELLTTLAYGIDAKQIKSAPAWFGSRRFDINAKAEEGIVLSREALRPRLQRLLRERFHMRMHHQTILTQGFALVVAQRAPKLASSKADQPPNFRVDVGPGKLHGTNWSMEFCALMLAPKVGMPVVDRTGLQGRYDVDVDYAPDISVESPLPFLPAAIQEKLGLRLVSQKVPVDVIVIDGAEEFPTEN